MPMILRANDYDSWLTQDTASVLRLLVPYAGEMRGYPVSTTINDAQTTRNAPSP